MERLQFGSEVAPPTSKMYTTNIPTSYQLEYCTLAPEQDLEVWLVNVLCIVDSKAEHLFYSNPIYLCCNQAKQHLVCHEIAEVLPNII